MRLGQFKADLHVHTCLSPCADLSMGPRAIVAKAVQRGLDVIGVADHNSAENALAVVNAAARRNLTVLAGLEVTTQEEVHVLALFDRVEEAQQLQELVYQHLPGENDPEAFGLQVVVSADHDVVGFNTRLLAGAAELSLERVVESIHALGGLAIAAHADRPAFGILGQLGFIPEQLPLDAVELSANTTPEEFRRRFPECAGRTFLRGSDAHTLEDVGTASTFFRLREPTTAEIKKAFRGEGGRQLSLAAAERSDAGRRKRAIG